MAKLVLATCQFPIHEDPRRNLVFATRQIAAAKARGAHLVHFSEACISGYLGVEVTHSHGAADWERIAAAMEEVMTAARRHRVWVVIGCNHRLSGRHKPHNSLYVIDSQGRIVNRYDKMFCTGASEKEGDLAHYSPGEALITFEVRGLTCGLLICHDFRYPELFREYKRKGVHLMLVSFHNAGGNKESCDRYKVTVPATLQAAAASNYYAVSANNGTRRHAWPSFVVNAQGMVVNKARVAPAGGADHRDRHGGEADRRLRRLAGPLHAGGAPQRQAGEGRALAGPESPVVRRRPESGILAASCPCLGTTPEGGTDVAVQFPNRRFRGSAPRDRDLERSVERT